MITLGHILPHTSLSLFVRYYYVLEFDTGDEELIRPWHATTENYIVFFLQDKPLHLKNEKTGYYVKGSHSVDVVGIATQFNGLMKFKGKYKCFTIEFTPNGFTTLLGVPQSICTDRIYDAQIIVGETVNILLDQLQGTSLLTEMANFADNFLFSFLRRLKLTRLDNCISAISNKLYLSRGSLSVKDCCNMANMSMRNFERNFKEQLGVSPKEYAKLLRYENAIRSKAKDSKKSWTTISYECGYFDQAHMLKDFYQFAGFGPKELFKTIPPPIVDKSYFISR